MAVRRRFEKYDGLLDLIADALTLEIIEESAAEIKRPLGHDSKRPLDFNDTTINTTGYQHADDIPMDTRSATDIT